MDNSREVFYTIYMAVTMVERIKVVMSGQSPYATHLGRLTRYAWLVAGAWTLFMFSVASYNILHIRNGMRELARNEAFINFNWTVVVRRWAAHHGGVYAPTDERTPPNPYLSFVPERDITTPSGRKLTLVNPAYMGRQIFEWYQDDLGIKGHFMSLKPIRPQNSPDPWERRALEEFERGVHEKIEFTDIDGHPHLRLIRPLKVEKPCLKCHAAQGYQEGQVRGGLSVSIPLDKYIVRERRESISEIIRSGIVWVIGIAAVWFGYLRLRKGVHEQEKAQRELQKTGEVMERMFSSIHVLVAYMDRDFNFIRVNQAYAEADEREPDFYIGKNHFDLFPNEENKSIFQKVVDTGEPIIYYAKPFEYAEHPERGVSYWDWRLEPVKGADGAVEGIILSLLNVTEHVKAIEELRHSEEKFRQFFENEPEYCYIVSPEGVIIDVNRSALNAMGYSREEMVGQPLRMIYASEELPKVKRLFEKWKTEGIIRDEELVIQTKSGEKRTILLSAGAVRDSSGRILHSISIQRDITERKKAELKLIQSERKLSLHLRQTVIGVIEWDIQFKATEWNPAAELIFGYTKGEAIGCHAADLILPKTVIDDVNVVWNKLLNQTGGQYNINENITKDGRIIICEWFNTALVNDRGEVIGVMSLVRDITESKRAEESLKEQLDELTRFQKATIDRELRMHEIKKENERLKARIEELEERLKI